MNRESYGGIYRDQPFSFNPKCIVFSLLMVSLYWLTARFSFGKPNYYLFPLILTISYIGLSYYDLIYDCSRELYSGIGYGTSIIDSIFKPQRREEQHKYQNVIVDQERVYQRNVYLFHILMIVPILFYVGFKGLRGTLKGKDWYVVLMVIASGALTYHLYRFFYPRQTCNIIKDKDGNVISIDKGNIPK